MVSVRKPLARAASVFRRVSRATFVVLLLAAILSPAFAQTGQLSLSLSNIVVQSTQLHMVIALTVSGTAIVSGPWSGGNLHFSGWFDVVGLYSPTPGAPTQQGDTNVTLSSGDFTPNPLVYPSQSSASFSVTQNGGFSQTLYYSYEVDAYDASGNLVASVTRQNVAGPVAGNPLFYLIAQLPQFNDSMLGATTATPGTSMPLGGYYNMLLGISLVVLAGSVFLALLGRMAGKESGSANIAMEVVTGVAVILLFPLIYNTVANIVNYLDMSLIAYPNPYTQYSAAINNLWNTAIFNKTWWEVLLAAIPTLAVWIMSLFAWLMSYFLGTVRLFLLAVLIVAFPLSIGLRLVPFAKKLGQMVEDTLYGLILASILSSLVIGVANNVITGYSGSLFQTAGVAQDWIAIAAIFAAILMPTVFAPLTGVMFQTVSQAAMAAGAGAAMIGAGIGAPVAGAAGMAGLPAFGQAFSAAGGLGQTGETLTQRLGTFGSALGAGFTGGLKKTGEALGGRQFLGEALSLGFAGVATGVGGVQATKMLRPSLERSFTGISERSQASGLMAQQVGHVTRIENDPDAIFGVAQALSAPNGDTFSLPVWAKSNASDDALTGAAKTARDYFTGLSATGYATEMNSHGYGDTLLKNPVAAERLSQDFKNRISRLNPADTNQAKTILAHKLTADMNQWKAAHGIEHTELK
jgi:hypothetical protein